MSELAHIFGVFLLLAAVLAVGGVLFLSVALIWQCWKDSRALKAFEKHLLEEAKLPPLQVRCIMKKAVVIRKGREE